MNKIIEKCEAYKQKTVSAALEKARTQYEDARGSYNDTGYDKYWNKMSRLEAEIDELEKYLERDGAIQAAIEEKAKVKKEIEEINKTLKNKIFYLLAAIPECSEGQSLRDYVERL